MIFDPVCGKEIKNNNESLGMVHNGNIYFFCSYECKLKFLMSPESYIKKNPGKELVDRISGKIIR